MSNLSPYELLGLSEDASFDEIQGARERLKAQHEGDRKQVEAIETAYDAVLMDRLRLRQQGKIKVPDRIRFPEKIAEAAPKPAPSASNRMPEWLQRLIDTPTKADILWPLGIFLVLGGISAYADPSLLQLTLVAGVGASIYFLNRKERKFGRAVLLTLAGLFGGLLIGALLGNVLVSANLIQLAFVNQVAALVSFFLLWLISSFLR